MEFGIVANVFWNIVHVGIKHHAKKRRTDDGSGATQSLSSVGCDETKDSKHVTASSELQTGNNRPVKKAKKTRKNKGSVVTQDSKQITASSAVVTHTQICIGCNDSTGLSGLCKTCARKERNRIQRELRCLPRRCIICKVVKAAQRIVFVAPMENGYASVRRHKNH